MVWLGSSRCLVHRHSRASNMDGGALVVGEKEGDDDSAPIEPLATGVAEQQSAHPPGAKTEGRVQAEFAVCLLLASLANAIALNLEAGYVGHIRADADTGSAQMAAFSVGSSFCSWFTELEMLWSGLAAQIGTAYGAGERAKVAKFMRMGFVVATCCGIAAWLIVFPFGAWLVEWAFVMHDDVRDYAIPFVYIHILGNFSMYIHNAAECMMQGMQHIKAFSLIYGCRGVCTMVILARFVALRLADLEKHHHCRHGGLKLLHRAALRARHRWGSHCQRVAQHARHDRLPRLPQTPPRGPHVQPS